ncbi:MAG: ATP-binding protein [Acidimicrobiales bacterium]
MDYRPRIVDDELSRQLRAMGAVVLEGPKAVGKTETGRRKAASATHLDTDLDARAAAAIDPALILGGSTPRLIDEWQVVPEVWNHVRREVDRRQRPGQFILTGSAVPEDDATRHTGAGRMVRLRMRPMTLFEMNHSGGEISLGDLFAGNGPVPASSDLPIPQLALLICCGGWPAIHALAVQDAQQALRNYLDEIVRTDIHGVDGIVRDPDKVSRVVRSLARNVSTQVAVTVIAADTAAEDEPVARKTVPEYLTALRRLMIVEDQPAWAPRLRSRSSLRTAPKRHFVDPCLATAALGATPGRLLSDLNYLGCLFESLVVRDLRVYAQPHGGRVLHYRDNTGLEVDVIIELADGRWAAIEVKLGSGQVDAGARGLSTFAGRIDRSHYGDPAFLAVVTARGYAYRRPDGILVLPIGTMGP